MGGVSTDLPKRIGGNTRWESRVCCGLFSMGSSTACLRPRLLGNEDEISFGSSVDGFRLEGEMSIIVGGGGGGGLAPPPKIRP